jgi:hypothetical protein
MENENQAVYLDKITIIYLLTQLQSIIEDKEKNESSIIEIDKTITSIIQNSKLDKERLVTRWIQINGEDPFKKLQVNTVEEYFKILPIIFKSSATYLEQTNDYLYLIAGLSIATDWFLYQGINLGNE